MRVFGAKPIDDVVQSSQIFRVEDRADDWDLVLRESHHRMKNTLTLLGASARRDFSRKCSTADLSAALDRFERRVAAFGKLYQLLSDDTGGRPVQTEEIFERLCEALSEALLEPAGISCEATIEGGELSPMQRHRLSLIIAELVTNAAKHAFPDGNGGRIWLEVVCRQGYWCCTVADNGVGAAGPLQGTGGRILENLARSIGAKIHGETGQSGTRVSIIIPPADLESAA